MHNAGLHAYIDGLDISEEEKLRFKKLLEEIRSNNDLFAAFLEQTDINRNDGGRHLFKNSEPTLGSFDTIFTAQNEATEAQGPVHPSGNAETINLDQINRPGHAPKIRKRLKTENDNKWLGRYQDLGLLGRGGMGEVRKVRDETLNRNLAMKIIYAHLLTHKSALSRFIEEAQVGAQLQHPNIVPIHELGKLPDGRYYFTMKEIRGIEFSHLLDEAHAVADESGQHPVDNGTSFRRLIQVFHKVCETIAFSHSVGVIHRDLKPENIMIGDFGEVLVVDWGIAKIMGQKDHKDDQEIQTTRTETDKMMTKMGVVTGTPAYMSPEQAMGRVDLIDGHSDIYSLGAILYEILTGYPPYTGESAEDVIKKVCDTAPRSLITISQKISGIELEPIPVEEVNANNSGKLPFELVEICQRAMHREIDKRYGSAEDLAGDIFDWLEGAQKRDKALKEVELAIELGKKLQSLEKQHQDFWFQANKKIQNSNTTQLERWELWEKSEGIQSELLFLNEKRQQKLQGALVHDAKLLEAHELLATYHIDQMISAISTGDLQRAGRLEKQFHTHLKYLTQEKAAEIQDLFLQQKQDQLNILRSKSGALIGRHELMREISNSLKAGSKLVSIIGTAGVGKTRLALEVIHTQKKQTEQAYFCDLTEASSELEVALLVAKAMNIVLGNTAPIEQIGEIFTNRSTILVLDNLEQIAQEAAGIIQIWLRQSESLKIIVTSRIRLQIEEEKVFQLHPLSQLEALSLFSKHGRKSDGRFQITNENFAVVSRVVSQLDNLPLAIELAASRLALFSVEEIEFRLKERFSLLRSRNKNTRALHGALNWSWDILKPWAKAVLSQASIFRGGFDLKAADAIVTIGQWKEAPPLFDILQDLCDNSLLRENKSTNGELRYSTLESIRAYASEKLAFQTDTSNTTSGKDATVKLQLRHAKYYARFGEEAFIEQIENVSTPQGWATMLIELDNLVAAAKFGSGKEAATCCIGAMKILAMKGPISLGIEIAAQLLKSADVPPLQRKKIQIMRTRFLRISGRMKEARDNGLIDYESGTPSKIEPPIRPDNSGDTKLKSNGPESNPGKIDTHPDLREAEKLLELGRIEEAESLFDAAMSFYTRALDIYERHDSNKGSLQSLIEIANIHKQTGNTKEAIEILEKARQIAKETSALRLLTDVLKALGNTYAAIGELTTSLDTYQQALTLSQKTKDKAEEGSILSNMAPRYQELGQYQKAIEHYTKALKINREIGNRRMEALTVGNMANVHTYLGEYDKALSLFSKAMEINTEIGNKSQLSVNIGNMAVIHGNRKNHEKALALYQQAAKISREVGDKRTEGRHLANTALIYMQMNNNHEALKFLNRALVINKAVQDRRAEAITLGNIGCLLYEMGRTDAGNEHLKKAIHFCDESKFMTGSHLFRGELALWLAKEGCFEASFGVLSEISDDIKNTPTEHGKILCKKSEVLLLHGQTREAQSVLREAENIVEALKPNHNETLEDAITEIKSKISHATNTQSTQKKTKHNHQTNEEDHVQLLNAEELLEKGRYENAVAQYDNALDLYDKSLRIYKNQNAIKGQIVVLIEISTTQRELGEPSASIETLEQADELLKTQPILSLKAQVMSGFGHAHAHLGKAQVAKGFFETALELNKEMGNKAEEAVNLGSIATILKTQGRFALALEKHNSALEINREIGNKRNECINLGNIALIYQNQKRFEEALENYHLILEINREIGNRKDEGLTLSCIAKVQSERKEHEAALSLYDQALVIAREVKNKRDEGITLGFVGVAHIELGNLQTAKTHLQEAVKICNSSSPAAAGFFMSYQAVVLMNLGRSEDAYAMLERGEDLVEQSPTAHCNFLCNKAKVFHIDGNGEKALKTLNQVELMANQMELDFGEIIDELRHKIKRQPK